MMAGAAEVAYQGILEAQYRFIIKEIEDIVDIEAAVAPPDSPVCCDAVDLDVDVVVPELDMRDSNAKHNSAIFRDEFIPTIRSGSFADIGPRTRMEDEHICIDDLTAHLGSMFQFPKPSAFYGVFDGHGGSDAAVYIKNHALRFLFGDGNFPQSSEVDDEFSEMVVKAIRKAYNLADLALYEDSTISSSSGTTALTALVFGRLLLVANAGDCRAVLCRDGKALEMSQDHRPAFESERKRIEKSGGYVDDGYLNGVLSVARALGDWDIKMMLPGSPSPLISEPEFRQVTLSEGDEFLIIGCDGLWDVMPSQHAVGIVRRGLRRHDSPERCARELVREALRLHTFDNLTVIVVCLNDQLRHRSSTSPDHLQFHGLRACRSLSTEAFNKLQSWLDEDSCN